MARKRLKLAFIENDAVRKSTFRKRKKGLMKKINELTTLCDVDACALIYSPYEHVPEVWPSLLGVQRVLTKFRKMPVMELTRKMDDQESFLRKSLNKTFVQMRKAIRDNTETEIRQMMFQCFTGERSLDDLTVDDLKNVSWSAGQTLGEVNNYIMKGLTVGESSFARNNLTSYQVEKPNIVATMDMTNAQPSNLGKRPQYDNYPSHPISNTNNYTNENMQMSSKNFVTSNNGDTNNEEMNVTINNKNNSNNNAELWSHGFFPWSDK